MIHIKFYLSLSILTWYQSTTCYPHTLAIENASEGVFDMLIFELERQAIEITLQFTNALSIMNYLKYL